MRVMMGDKKRKEKVGKDVRLWQILVLFQILEIIILF